MSRRFTIWQCTDWCCEDRPHYLKWWNVGYNPGNYHSVRTWGEAMRMATRTGLPWS